jgi:diaminopropionate ammonia-lyase
MRSTAAGRAAAFSAELRRDKGELSPCERSVLGVTGERAAHALVSACPHHRETPLRDLPDLAAMLNVASIRLKDESLRFGLQSFKALGAGHCVAAILEAAGLDLNLPNAAAGYVFACASDGNHGRSLAFAARHFGAAARIFVPHSVSEPRRDAIRRLGADLTIVEGTYDEAVDAAAQAARANGWTLLSDTSTEPEDTTTAAVMRGYTVLIAEACDAAEAEAGPFPASRPFTHVLVQAGVGGLAAAATAYLFDRYGASAPQIVVVEPEAAACLADAARAGVVRRIPGALETIMGMLSCGEASHPAWAVLEGRVSAYVTLPDTAATAAVRWLASRSEPIEAGESGAAGVAALLAAAGDPDLRHNLQFGPQSRVLAILTEGPTDPESFARIVGHLPAACRPAAGKS